MDVLCLAAGFVLGVAFGLGLGLILTGRPKAPPDGGGDEVPLIARFDAQKIRNGR